MREINVRLQGKSVTGIRNVCIRERVGREERRRLPEESITIGQLVANDARR